jgi:gliding motility-associated-like protein
VQPDCDGYTSGSVRILSSSGGLPPYVFTQSGDTTLNLAYDSLSAGAYTITQTDQNGCTNQANYQLLAPAIPVVALPDTVTIYLGDSTRIVSSLNQFAHHLAWTPVVAVECDTCGNTFVRPFRSTWYTLTATSDSGCVHLDSILVTVIAQYDVYVPNAFKPDESTQNTIFTVYGGSEVVKIRRFSVYDRWGDLVHQQTNLAANDESRGWNGTSRGRRMPAGVYVWMADIEFLDGKVEVYSGDVSLIR